jgi:uncharacterized protein (TIGR00255 family)
MIKSMTGYSKADANSGGSNVTLEIKSVNGKNLDLTTRMPRDLAFRENEMKDIVRKFTTRGSVTIYINIDNDKTKSSVNFDKDAAQATWNELGELKQSLKLKETIKLDHLFKFSDSFISKEVDKDEEQLWKAVKDALYAALKDFDRMRTAEGKHLFQDMNKRIGNIHEATKKAETRGLERIPEEREKMRDRIAKLFENEEIDEHRLQMEIVVMADKLDITEECVRLYSHLKQFREFMESKQPQGRKLNFLLQEMNREVNTIGSKANDPEISYLVVGMKEEIERVREQVQNVE